MYSLVIILGILLKWPQKVSLQQDHQVFLSTIAIAVKAQ